MKHSFLFGIIFLFILLVVCYFVAFHSKPKFSKVSAKALSETSFGVGDGSVDLIDLINRAPHDLMLGSYPLLQTGVDFWTWEIPTDSDRGVHVDRQTEHGVHLWSHEGDIFVGYQLGDSFLFARTKSPSRAYKLLQDALGAFP